MKIAVSALIASAGDSDHDILTLTAFDTSTTNHGSIQRQANLLLFTPADDHSTDAFTYTIDDSHGGVATGAVVIAIEPLPNDRTVRMHNEAGDSVFGFLGNAGATYFVQFTTDIANPTWTSIGAATEGPAGTFHWRDAAPADRTRFYRIVAP